MRTQEKLRQINEARGFGDPPLYLIGVFELAQTRT